MKIKVIIFIALIFALVGCKGPRPNDSSEAIALTAVNEPISSTDNSDMSFGNATENDSSDDSNDEALNTTQTDVLAVDTNTTNTTTNTNTSTTQTTKNKVVQPVVESVPVNTNSVAGCTLRTDLPMYTVIAGDTLFGIATRANMSVDDVVSINCLQNRNVIEVGQQLRLTTAINTNSSNGTTIQNTTTTTNTNANNVRTEGTLVISPWQTNSGNIYRVRTDLELTVQWMGVPTNLGLTQVEFIYVDNRSINSPQSIGIDSDLSNGAMILWNPPEIIQGTVYAVARMPGQQHQSVRSQTSTVVTYVEPELREIGNISISPWQSNNGNNYTVNTTMELTLQWKGMPTDLGLIQAEFIFVPDRPIFSPTSLGIDTNLSDGAMVLVNWNNPNMELRGKIFATARIPGQQHEGVQSYSIRVEPDNRPMLVGPRGALSIDPNIQAGTPADWSDYVVQAGQTVTVSWTGVDPAEYNTLRIAALHYYPDDGSGEQIIAHDNNRADGFNFAWTVPAEASGVFKVNGIIGDTARVIFSPEIHVRTPKPDTARCEFNPFIIIDGDVTIYREADMNSASLGIIQTATSYPVMAQGGSWANELGDAGTFYQIQLGNALGWVQDNRGELIGDCSSL